MLHRLAALAATAAAVALPMGTVPAGFALAQSDPAALQLIERLRPQPGGAGQTRGIRIPGGAEATPQGTTPAATPSGATPKPPGATTAGAAAPPRLPRPPAVRETTAPAGVPAASIIVTFATGSATLTPQAEAVLAPLGRALSSTELAPYRFRIEGHTDTVGDTTMNQALSERRAAAVRDYLVTRFGVDAARLEAVGLGETQLLVPTRDETPEGRNRRVQVLNLGG
jgi:OmpA-OmpF porin, OOP family